MLLPSVVRFDYAEQRPSQMLERKLARLLFWKTFANGDTWKLTSRERRQHERMVRKRCYHPSRLFTPFPRSALENSISKRFESIAAKYPNRLAIVSPSTSLTYRRLADAASRVTRAILTPPSDTQGPVALLLGRDVHMFSAMLGVLKSGRSYVPLDSDLPSERLSYMLNDSGASILLSDNQSRAKLNAIDCGKTNTILVDDLTHDSYAEVDSFFGPDSEALVLYTSGSTGRPKGFVQTHRNVLHDTMHYTDSGHFCAEDRFLLVSSFSFADSIRTIYGALLNGACLYPFAVKQHGLSALRNWIYEHEITIYRSVPTLFRQFASVLDDRMRFPTLRLIYLSGEPVYRSDFALYRDYFSDDCVLVNRLGTGEALTFRCYFMDKDTPIRDSYVPVGYEVPDKEVVLLDDQSHPLQEPGMGEIAVRSSYLSPGYLNNPQLSATVFVPDPWKSDLRMYRTGDLGELLADGCLIHMGRKDFQTKIRGHRVELGEVETTLMEHPDVKEAVVTANHDDQNNVNLLAYVTARDHAVLSVSRLIQFAKSKLPLYMVPARFTVLPELPLTSTGKIDRNALPQLARTRPELDNPLSTPRTAVERELAKIWSDVLGLEAVGIHDNFLELGGDSMRAMQIINRVSSSFNVSFSMSALFLQASTIAEMDEFLEAK